MGPGSDGGGNANGATGGVEAAGASGRGGRANKGVAFDLALALALALACLAAAFLLFTVLGAVLSVTVDTMSTSDNLLGCNQYCCG